MLEKSWAAAGDGTQKSGSASDSKAITKNTNELRLRTRGSGGHKTMNE